MQTVGKLCFDFLSARVVGALIKFCCEIMDRLRSDSEVHV